MQDILVFAQHHMVLSSGLIAVFLLLVAIEFIRMKRSPARLSPGQLTYFINHKNAIVMDVRTLEAYNSGHIVDAISVPFQDINSMQKKIEKFKSQPVVLVCASGMQSQKTANLLQKNQFQVYVLAGGINAWKAANMPLVKGK